MSVRFFIIVFLVFSYFSVFQQLEGLIRSCQCFRPVVFLIWNETDKLDGLIRDIKDRIVPYFIDIRSILEQKQIMFFFTKVNPNTHTLIRTRLTAKARLIQDPITKTVLEYIVKLLKEEKENCIINVMKHHQREAILSKIMNIDPIQNPSDHLIPSYISDENVYKIQSHLILIKREMEYALEKKNMSLLEVKLQQLRMISKHLQISETLEAYETGITLVSEKTEYIDIAIVRELNSYENDVRSVESELHALKV
jgi:hypothetical protein